MKKVGMEQRTVKGLGELYEAFMTALPVVSAIQFASILTLLYNQYRVWLIGIFPWLTLVWFLVIIGIILIIAMILVYKFLIPSLWTFRGKQLYGFESELMEEVKALRKEIKELKEGK